MLKAKQTQKRKSTPLEPDVYFGRLVQVIDLGLQPQKPWQGKEKDPVHQISVTYELVSEFLLDDDGNPQEDKPRWISETFPLYSLNADKAKSTQRYLALDPSQEYQGDWEAILGRACQVQVTQYESDGVTRNGVGSLTPPMRGVEVPALVNDSKVFLLDNPDMEVYKGLPDWLQEKIASNLEFRGSKLEALLSGNSPASAPTAETTSTDADAGVDEDLPV